MDRLLHDDRYTSLRKAVTTPIGTAGGAPSRDELLRRGLARQLEQASPRGVGSALAKRRVHITGVTLNDNSIVTVTNDREQGGIAVAGVAVADGDIPAGQLNQFWDACAAFDAAQNDEEQRAARITISQFVQEFLRRDSNLDAMVRQRVKGRG